MLRDVIKGERNNCPLGEEQACAYKGDCDTCEADRILSRIREEVERVECANPYYRSGHIVAYDRGTDDFRQAALKVLGGEK